MIHTILVHRKLSALTRLIRCHSQIHADDLLNTKSWAVRPGTHITWTVLVELPSYVFSADSMRSWDQAAVAAAMVPPPVSIGANSACVVAVHGSSNVTAGVEKEQQCAAPAALLSSHTSL